MVKPFRSSSFDVVVEKPKRKRKGIHAKRGSSQSPTSKNYKKKYHGQGRT
jgi:hypothetical protein